MKKGLVKIVGENGVSEKAADRIAYSSDASQILGNALYVVWPADAEQVHQLVLFAKRTRTVITPRGGGVGICGGASAKNSMVVDMSKMNKILKIDNDTVTVQAGVTLQALNNTVSMYCLPLESFMPGVATIGGMVAVDIKGHRGKVSDYVTELRVVDGTGKLMKVKGNDLKAFCGKEGRTGIIVEATLRLKRKSLSEESTMAIFSFNTIAPLMKKIEELKGQLNVIKMGLLDEACSKLAGLEEQYHLIVEFSDDSGNILSQDDIKNMWKAYTGVCTQLLARRLTVVLDPKVGSGMDKFLYWLKKHSIPVYGSIGRGVVFPHFKHNDPRIKETISVALQLGGSLGEEHGFGLLKKGLESDESKAEMKELKIKYDPSFVMNLGGEK